MLKLIKKPKKGKPADCTFDKPFENQKMGIEMLMCCNMNNRDYIIGPDVGLDANIIVQREKPHYLFNPTIDDDDAAMLRYVDYMGAHVARIRKPSPHLLEAMERLNAEQSRD